MKITKKHQQYDNLCSSFLNIRFNNCNVSNVHINTIRRILMDGLPIYAFDPNYMKFTKNTGYQNNDQLKLRFSLVPVVNITTDKLVIPYKYYQKVIDFDKGEEPMENEQRYEAYINVLNKTKDIINVTTHDFKIVIDGVSIQNPYLAYKPFLITRLRTDEELSCKLIAKIRIGIYNNAWAPVYKTAIKEHEYEKDYELTYYSYIPNMEIEYFNKACDVICQRLIDYRNTITDETDTELELKFADKSIASIINYELQRHNGVIFSGMRIPTLLDHIVFIKIIFKEKDTYKQILYECIDNLITIYNKIKTTFNIK